MSDHDPLCPAYRPGPLRAICECTLITKTAERERERIAQAIEAAEPVGWNMVARKDAARIARNGGRDE